MARTVKTSSVQTFLQLEEEECSSPSSEEIQLDSVPRRPSTQRQRSADCVEVIEGLVLQQMGVVWRGRSPSATSSSENDDTENNGEVHNSHPLPLPSPPSDVIPMAVDTCEDLWTRLHDTRINGCLLEYTGQGKSIYDNGLAQSNSPLTPLSHYFEVTIVHPGESCYIAIGLARKDYPVHKHPGWNRGSIAYHAEDGKIFIGSGVGTPFGPRCSSKDVLGCGIVFPSKMNTSVQPKPSIEESPSDGGEWVWEADAKMPVKKAVRVHPPQDDQMDNVPDASSESEDDLIWWNNRNQVYEDKVQVFFMRNGKLLGIKEIRIPKGGFYPTIGMMSRNEKVMVDMNPLSG